MSVNVAVVGAGIIGVTTAYRILNELKNVAVTLISEDFSPNTTGDGSAGFLMPYALGNTTPDVLSRWCKESFDYFKNLYLSDKAGKLGIGLLTIYYLSENRNFEHFSFSDAFLNYRELTSKELEVFPSKWQSGVIFTSYFVECTKFLPYLMKLFTEQGGKIIKKKVNTLASLDYDIVINCCGVNAGFLSGDYKVTPIRGQVMRVRAPWIKNAVLAGNNYILPNSDYVILGGTKQKGDWNLKVDEKDSKDIIEGCSKLIPSLKEAEIIKEWVGLRPYRETVRIEHEAFNVNGNVKNVIHNYGHGGSGVTLCWGSASDVLNILIPLITKNKL